MNCWAACSAVRTRIVVATLLGIFGCAVPPSWNRVLCIVQVEAGSRARMWPTTSAVAVLYSLLGQDCAPVMHAGRYWLFLVTVGFPVKLAVTIAKNCTATMMKCIRQFQVTSMHAQLGMVRVCTCDFQGISADLTCLGNSACDVGLVLLLW